MYILHMFLNENGKEVWWKAKVLDVDEDLQKIRNILISILSMIQMLMIY